MPFIDICLEALHSLAANKLRSGFTMLGMVIGVASVIVMVSIGQGSQRAIKQTIATLGSNLLIIFPPNNDQQIALPSTLSQSDAAALEALPILQTAAGVLGAPNGTLTSYNGDLFTTPVIGTAPSFFTLREWRVTRGTLFNDDDITHQAAVAIIGASTAKKIFKQENPVGRFVTMSGQRVQVIGLLRSKGQTLDGRDQDDLFVVPLSFVRQRLMHDNVHKGVDLIYTRPRDGVAQETAKLYIQRAIRASHALEIGTADDFQISDVKSVAEGALKAGHIMTLLLGSIASVSLIVGGIGIMNIMLVCVTERTREIGIRKAIGASRNVILFQFLCEAVMIALIGCIVGMILGITAILITAIDSSIPTELNAWPVAAAFIVAVATGVFFGLYPARKASHLLPVEALRY